MNSKGIRLLTIGDTEGLTEGCRNELKRAIELTSHNVETSLVLALNYSARWEIVEASKIIARKVASGELAVDQIDDALLTSSLTTSGIPDPELLIRTSGERRISNFLLWQIAYTDFYFADVLWPDFKMDDLFKAVLDYQSRERRFGLVSAQITK